MNIKVRKLCHSEIHIFTELGEVYGCDKVCYETVCGWGMKLLTGADSVKDSAKADGPVTVTSKCLKSRGNKSDGRYYTIRKAIPSFFFV
jgi:hypothetical protein